MDITVIPKAIKDHTQCANYHPVSLTDVGTNISRLLENRLEQVILFAIKNDQTGFTKTRQVIDRLDLIDRGGGIKISS